MTRQTKTSQTYRLSQAAVEQIKSLAASQGRSQATVIEIAVDRMYREDDMNAQMIADLKAAAAETAKEINAANTELGFYALRKVAAIQGSNDPKAIIRACDDIALIAGKVQKDNS